MSALDQTTRLAVVNKALERAGIPAEQAEIRQRREQWAEDARRYQLGGTTESIRLERLAAEFQAKYDELPDHIKSWSAELFNFETSLTVDGERLAYPEGGSKLTARVGYDDNEPAQWVGDSPELMERWGQILIDEAAARDRSRDVRHQVQSAVHGVRTVEELLKEWPEAVDLLPEGAPRELPGKGQGIPRAELNKLLKMGPDDANP